MGRREYKLYIHVNADELAEFEKAFAASSSPSRAVYARKLLFGKAIRIYYRDRAFDAFTEAAVQFNKDIKLLLAESGVNEEAGARLVLLAEEIKAILIKIDDHVRKTRKNRQPPLDA